MGKQTDCPHRFSQTVSGRLFRRGNHTVGPTIYSLIESGRSYTPAGGKPPIISPLKRAGGAVAPNSAQSFISGPFSRVPIQWVPYTGPLAPPFNGVFQVGFPKNNPGGTPLFPHGARALFRNFLPGEGGNLAANTGVAVSKSFINSSCLGAPTV